MDHSACYVFMIPTVTDRLSPADHQLSARSGDSCWDRMVVGSSLGLRRSSLSLAPLAVSGVDGVSPSSSTGVSPSSPSHQLSESGNVFKIGHFEIGRDGVTEKSSSPTAANAPISASADGPPAGGFGLNFEQLQMLQVIGRGASGFVRRAELLRTAASGAGQRLSAGTMLAVKEICMSSAGTDPQGG